MRMKTIKRGSKNSDVKTLQSLLNADAALNLSKKLKVDGIFGKATEAAVITYQKLNGLKPDGIVGNATWSKLLGIPDKKPVDYKQYDPRWGKNLYTIKNDKSQTMASSGCGPTAMANVIATFFDKNVTPWDMAQLAMKYGHRTKNDGTAWSFFDFIGKEFPNKYPFGAYYPTSNHDKFLKALKEGALIVCSMGPGYWTKGGHFITAWKYDGTYVYANDPASTTRTRQKLSDFKKQRKQYFIFYPPIAKDEPVEPETPVEVIPAPPVVTPAPAPTPTPSPDVAAKMGDKGNHVIFVQRKLNALKYSVGTVDAIFGSKTKAALEKFQKDVGIPVNGNYDAKTDAAMADALKMAGLDGQYFGPTGIYDISKWQGYIDFKKVYESGKVGLLILRVGYGQNTVDPKFHTYMKDVQKYKIPFGVYWFSYATSAKNAENEIDSFYKIASAYRPLFYVLDAEDRRVDGSFINAAAKRLKAISDNAKTGLYVANHLFSEYKSEGMDTALWDFIWIPRYSNTPPTHRPCDLWQKEGTKIPGISGSVDTNYIAASGRYNLQWFLREEK